ncbi:hypothetical protein BU23DRAFT_71907 [Bimuria novae-zelandiae CBS 107.79]|uniref:Uncharacterized protein n=1 Tax=Bimuria novae-zelandiae CBS 107.79 TaxID=1447943 RepID=A0A6A5USV2_9PLEO|nr:hypothetical protein BU23DRAFT_71907 [Bimuria novae-zelandiae CBS 107.79]
MRELLSTNLSQRSQSLAEGLSASWPVRSFKTVSTSSNRATYVSSPSTKHPGHQGQAFSIGGSSLSGWRQPQSDYPEAWASHANARRWESTWLRDVFRRRGVPSQVLDQSRSAHRQLPAAVFQSLSYIMASKALRFEFLSSGRPRISFPIPFSSKHLDSLLTHLIFNLLTCTS